MACFGLVHVIGLLSGPTISRPVHTDCITACTPHAELQPKSPKF